MTKTTVTTTMPKFEMPKFDMPKFDMPKFDGASLLGYYDANVETMLAVQKVMLDYTRTLAGRQVTLMGEAVAKMEATMKGGVDTSKKPEAYVEAAKAAVEKAVADAKETVELGMKAHGEVVQLITKRTQANIEQAKTIAA